MSIDKAVKLLYFISTYGEMTLVETEVALSDTDNSLVPGNYTGNTALGYYSG